MSDKHYSLKVASINDETDQAKLITLNVQPELEATFDYQHGQYLTFVKSINGIEYRRSYSICAGSQEKKLQVAVKRVEGGVFSNFVNDELKVGEEIDVLPPAGSFTTPLNADNERNLLFIAAGSGITPVISIIRSILEGEPKSRITLLFGNQKVATIMFRENLELLKNAYLSRFQLIHVLSREKREFDLFNGRIDNKKGVELCERMIDLNNVDEFFLCGPEAMISEVSRGLRGNGIQDSQIHYELFGASAVDAASVIAKHQQRAEKLGGRIFNVTIKADGRETSFELSPDGENILDAATDAGLDLPFACKGGVCATCKAKLLHGEVEMDINHALEASEINNGTILTCQAHPTSDDVFIDFDTAV